MKRALFASLLVVAGGIAHGAGANVTATRQDVLWVHGVTTYGKDAAVVDVSLLRTTNSALQSGAVPPVYPYDFDYGCATFSTRNVADGACGVLAPNAFVSDPVLGKGVIKFSIKTTGGRTLTFDLQVSQDSPAELTTDTVPKTADPTHASFISLATTRRTGTATGTVAFGSAAASALTGGRTDESMQISTQAYAY